MWSSVQRGLDVGTDEANFSATLRMFTGFAQIRDTGYAENPSIHRSFAYTDEIRQTLNEVPIACAYTPRVLFDGLIAFEQRSLGGGIIGIDPQSERSVTTLLDRLHEGAVFGNSSSNDILVGYTMLENLRAAIGDTVVILAQGYYGSLCDQKFRIAGTLKTGITEFDGMTIVMGMAAAQELLGLENRVHSVAISLNNLDDVDPFYHAVRNLLPPGNARIEPWYTILPDLKQSAELNQIGGIIFSGILVMIVAFGILNAILMSVVERFREFGILIAIGMSQLKLAGIVAVETLFQALIGILCGNMLAVAVNAYFTYNPVKLSGEYAEIVSEYGYQPSMHSTLDPSIFLYSTILMFLTSLLASLYPAIRVYVLEPLKGIRHT